MSSHHSKIGQSPVYPMLPDETCWFLAADFDKASWQEDVRAFLGNLWCLSSCRPLSNRDLAMGVTFGYLLRPVPAALARQMGTFLLSQTMEHRPEIGSGTPQPFLFPARTRFPKGGFGNLIALPLQKKPRGNNNSVFVNEQFISYEDQWSFLATQQRMTQAIASRG